MSYLDLFNHIRAFVFDIDGVMTDGKVIILPNGEQMRHMHSKDGYALQLAVKKGYPVAVISGSNSIQVKERLQALGLTDVYLKSAHKDESMEDFMFSYDLKPEEIMYMGDDIPDIAALQMIGLPACPVDAAPEVKQLAKFISKKPGGEGCVREIIELVMKTQGKWFDPEKNSDNLAAFTW
jgi:3-deoxy-D-manno-octulosonate 8-phosphate phosphatase (KDO 8-P phosphatase)